MTAAGTTTPKPGAQALRRRTARIAAALSTWIVGGFVLILWALEQRQTRDEAASYFHIPAYLGMAVLALYLGVGILRAVRAGRGWREGIPAGFGFLAAGLVALLAVIVLDLGWRQGVGLQPGIESSLGPTRVLLGLGLVLIAAAPLRAALKLAPGSVPLPVQLLSASLVLGVVAWPGGFHPGSNLWPERATDRSNDTGELWVMADDGSHQTRLLQGDATTRYGYASWSPSGAKMAFTAFTGPDGDDSQARAAIWIADADGGSPHAVTAGEDLSWIPRWSPDESRIVFTREAVGGPWRGGGPEGPGQGQQQGVGGPLSVPTTNADIWQVSVDGSGAAVQLTHGPGDNRAPVYSPDGSQILFDTTRDGNTEIYVMNADGSNQRRLTDDPAEDWGASWSPDGRRIAFNSYRTGRFELYVMNADGSDVEQVTRDEGDNVSPSWSPDGTALAYTDRSVRDQSSIWTLNLASGARRNISQLAAGSDTVWTGGWGLNGSILFSRSLPDPPDAAPLVRENLGAASLLITCGFLAAVLTLLARTTLPLGSYAAVLTLGTLLGVAPTERWVFVPAALAVGLLVEVAAWALPARLRMRGVGGMVGAGMVLASASVAMLGAGLAWSPSLVIGVAAACGAVGWGIGAIAGIRPADPQAGAG